ncbi:hypothetical protein [Microbacterium flavum]|uniref:Lipoprotein n=1 Tax=Microbacterium flavum TaxID=415216 RepID=A0ABS5XZ96_9MICO|nr:hypothetical protein [Microbacterium flavum]MBT8798618.1 hypothetical protein [Microbacterium flavum]
MRRRIALWGVLLAAGLSLAGCAGGGASDGTATEAAPPSVTSPSPTHATASSTPTSSATPSASATPALSQIGGTWCRADDPGTCMTVGTGGAPIASAPDEMGVTPCLAVIVGDDGGARGIYCPAGARSGAPLTTTSDDARYDRLFTSQAPPNEQTWYREADVQAATQG